MTPTQGLTLVDMIDGTNQRVDLLTQRVQYLEWAVLVLVATCAALLLLSWLLLAALYCLARASIGPPPWAKPKPKPNGQ